MKNRIKALRREMGYTQQEVADRLGVTKAAVAQYENDKTENIKKDKLLALAAMLNVSPAYIMGWSDMRTEPSGRELNIIEGYRRLNDTGKSQLELRLWELSQISDYTDDTIIPDKEESLMPVAAHADGVSTEELRAEVERIKRLIDK